MPDQPTSSQAVSEYLVDRNYQDFILPGVSRTFALTIPVLPGHLAEVVTNAYLLCRIADTIEDDPGLDERRKGVFHRRLLSAIKGRRTPGNSLPNWRRCCLRRSCPTKGIWCAMRPR